LPRTTIATTRLRAILRLIPRVAPRTPAALALALAALAASGCGPIVEQAPFPARPDAVRPADLLGPYDGMVSDADSERPIAGAVVAGSWAFERGIGAQGPMDAEEFVTQTGADGRYTIPRLSRLPTGASARVRRFTLIVYQRGYVAWRSDRRFPGRERRRDFSQRANRVRLDKWQPTLSHGPHLLFLGGGAKIREASSWEAEQAAVELEGEGAGRGRTGAEAAARRGPALLLDVSGLLSVDEIRGVTGYVGKFEEGKLADLPSTEFYDSRHFKAEGRPESYDVGLRVWRLGTAAEVQYQKLERELTKGTEVDEIGDASFRAQAGAIQGLVFLVRERGAVVSLTCGSAQCTDPSQILKIGKLVESRLADLPLSPPVQMPPAAAPPAAAPGRGPAGGAPGAGEEEP
jgi:hypothetical protein